MVLPIRQALRGCVVGSVKKKWRGGYPEEYYVFGCLSMVTHDFPIFSAGYGQCGAGRVPPAAVRGDQIELAVLRPVLPHNYRPPTCLHLRRNFFHLQKPQGTQHFFEVSLRKYIGSELSVEDYSIIILLCK